MSTGQLKQAESKLVEAFRRMPVDAQQELVRFAVASIVRPAVERPNLRIIAGGYGGFTVKASVPANRRLLDQSRKMEDPQNEVG
jgi:hypothetical protein